MSEYLYDVFLSFTGADRELKDAIKQRFAQMGLSYYDSDAYCKGQFREDFCEALDKSKVYLMLLTDNLRNDPLITQHGRLTEVRRECNLACELESTNQLNIVILCMSEFFRYSEPFHDYNDSVGWFFYSATRGFSQVFGTLNENGALSEKTLEEVTSRCEAFIQKRNAGQPVISQMPKLEISSEQQITNIKPIGREAEIENVLTAFSEGKQVVVLHGLGGMGKTTLAIEIAQRFEQMGYLKCPQIVHIQELSGERGGLYTLVSSASYVKSVYDSLNSLTEKEKYERKLQALCNLPETVLLVVDNYNLLDNEDLHEIISRLKCRLLITTRARINANSDKIAVVPIEKLDEPNAKIMFDEIYGADIPLDTFKTLYNYVGGHTITLCIFAKMMKAHGMGIDDIIGKMDNLDTLDAKIDFRHNENKDYDTIFGHLQKLFKINCFGDGCLHILRSMSVLSDGTISVADLMNILKLTNRNDINELVNNGWLELQRVSANDGVEENLYLHPILSRLMAKLLVPTEQSVSEMIEYLVRQSDAAMKKLTYADATALGDGLFYACFVLAGGNHNLSQELWSRFVSVDYLLGDASATTQKVNALAKLINNVSEQAMIIAYGDMVVLEQHPTRVDLLEKYIATLNSNAVNYKWVMRCLSVTMAHISSVKEYRSKILSIIDKAFVVAMENKDDFSVFLMISYFTNTEKSANELKKQLHSYINQRKADGEKSGMLIWLEAMYFSLSLIKNNKLSDLIEKAQELINNLFDNNFQNLSFLLQHPILAVRGYHLSNDLYKRIEKGSNDPMVQMLVGLSKEIEKALEGDKMDATKIIEIAVNVHMMNVNNNTTLTSASTAVMSAINSLRMFPESVIQKGVWELTEQVDMENISVRALSSLQVAALINMQYGNREAIKQARELISVVRHLRPEGHSDILAAIESYGDTCATFGEHKRALDAYIEVFRHWHISAPDSIQLSSVSRKILRLNSFETYSIKSIIMVAEFAIKSLDKTERYLYETLRDFVIRIFLKCKNFEPKADITEAMKFLWDIIDDAIASLNSITYTGQMALLYLLEAICNYSINNGNFGYVEAVRQRYAKIKKSRKKNVSKSATAYSLAAVAYAAYHRKDDNCAELLNNAVKYCIAHKTERQIANNYFWLLIPHWIPELSERDSDPTTDMLYKNFISSPVLLKNLEQLTEVFYSRCIKIEEGATDVSPEIIRFNATKYMFINMAKNNLGEMCITFKEYKSLRSTEKFYYLCFYRLMQKAIETYKDNKILIRKEPKK